MSVLSYGSTGSNSQINALLSEGLKRRKVQTHKMQISPKLSWLRPRSIQTRQVLCYITLRRTYPVWLITYGVHSAGFDFEIVGLSPSTVYRTDHYTPHAVRHNDR